MAAASCSFVIVCLPLALLALDLAFEKRNLRRGVQNVLPCRAVARRDLIGPSLAQGLHLSQRRIEAVGVRDRTQARRAGGFPLAGALARESDRVAARLERKATPRRPQMLALPRIAAAVRAGRRVSTGAHSTYS